MPEIRRNISDVNNSLRSTCSAASTLFNSTRARISRIGKEVRDIIRQDDFDQTGYISRVIQEMDAKVIGDLGCGHACLLTELSEAFPEKSFHGYEIKGFTEQPLPDNLHLTTIQPCALRKIRQHDLLVVDRVLHHSKEDPDAFLSDVFGALNDDGELIMREHALAEDSLLSQLQLLDLTYNDLLLNNPNNRDSKLQTLFRVIKVRKMLRGNLTAQGGFNYFGAKQMIQLLERHRFRITETSNVGNGWQIKENGLCPDIVYRCKKA